MNPCWVFRMALEGMRLQHPSEDLEAHLSLLASWHNYTARSNCGEFELRLVDNILPSTKTL
jgi:hypothetical protein